MLAIERLARAYRAANTQMWKFGTNGKPGWRTHYIIDVHGTLVRRHVDQYPFSGGMQGARKNIIPTYAPEISHHQRFEKTTPNIQHAETAEDISKDLNKELGSSSVQVSAINRCCSSQIYHSLQLKRLTPRRRGVHQFQTGHFLGVPGESGGLRRDLFFKEGGDVGIFNCKPVKDLTVTEWRMIYK
ncbi:hypothetical protein TNCV_2633341 [Trichonephila clavipes]|nr:hypothetical protein TNCV_2633341 [Trichonephila clavipes]